jgi:hypothetical protein
MALSIDDIMSSLSGLIGGGNNGATAYAAPDSGWSPTQSQLPSFGSLAGNSFGQPKAPASGNFGGTGFGLNTETAQLGLSGLQSLAGIFNSLQANKLAKDQFNFTKDITNTNLNNQIKSYNTSLADRINSRTFTQNQDQSVAQDYLDKNRLSR